MTDQIDLGRLTKASRAIYLATDKVVADDINAILTEARDEIVALRARNQDLEVECPECRHQFALDEGAP